MGLYPGQVILVIKNDKEFADMIIGIGETRIIIAREIASEIMTRLME